MPFLKVQGREFMLLNIGEKQGQARSKQRPSTQRKELWKITGTMVLFWGSSSIICSRSCSSTKLAVTGLDKLHVEHGLRTITRLQCHSIANSFMAVAISLILEAGRPATTSLDPVCALTAVVAFASSYSFRMWILTQQVFYASSLGSPGMLKMSFESCLDIVVAFKTLAIYRHPKSQR